MKLLFVHDFSAEYYDGKYYSMGFSYKIWERYLNVFDELLISSRFKQGNQAKDTNESSGRNVNFRPITSYKAPISLIFNHKDIIEKLTLSIKESDGVLIRVPSMLGFIAAIICQKLGKKYMVEVVGAAFDAFWFHGSFYGKALSFPMEVLQKRAVKHASVAIYVTKLYLNNKYPCKGKEYSGISNVQDIAITKKNLDIRKNVKVGLIGSTYVDYKGHDVAIKAIKELKDQGLPVSLEIVGEGPNPKFLQLAKNLNLEDEIIFKGKIYGKELLNNWFKTLDFYIQPSLTEGHCRAIVEAIGNGLPTLASKAGGNSDSVNEEFLFQPKDYKKLAKLIKYLYESKSLREKNVEENQYNISIYDAKKLQHRREEALNSYKKIISNQ
ncbi:glycosyltransferase [Staphylococcus devriesei]|uniref:glycosyltransferase n=1 Tax=Staphylococcus devriesei TaxID=586733 RepID=UPI001F4407B2|nr:glycosyltransferase [Staphylococcus devriesei]MCE5090377.1 glycosyltransferase family 4 protein [Staphylococcus devriesei]